MSDPENSQEELGRLWQEAKVYESHGLHDQAVIVYQSILSKEPDNRKAQAKVVQIQFTQRMADTKTARRISPDEPSVQELLDLGLAYMGMNLYEDALESFTEAIESSPALRPELLRYVANSLVGLYKWRGDEDVFDKILFKPMLTAKAKGVVASQAIEILLEQRDTLHAQKLLGSFSKKMKYFTKDYASLIAKVVGLAAENYHARVSSAESDRYDTQSDSANDFTESIQSSQVVETSIPLNAGIRYSFDNKHWLNGIASRLSAGWALIHLAEVPDIGDSLVLQLHLPVQKQDEPVWVLAKITKISSENQPIWPDFPIASKADFATFLPGGEVILKAFIDEVVNDPSILAENADIHVEGFTERATSVFDTLHRAAFNALGEAIILESSGTVPAESQDQNYAAIYEEDGAGAKGSIRSEKTKVRFACRCGQIHIVGKQNIGRKGKCKNCGQPLTVPLVDARRDQISEQITGKTIGGCRLLYKLGGGGMGGVFKAHHIGLDIPVAVKILYTHLAAEDPIFIRRFVREARAAAKLQHPNIVGVMNVGYENGLHYLVMPYIEGGSAAILLAKSGRLPMDKVLQTGIEIARALSLAEENNLLHRDVKPANILFSARGEAMLADLGLAKTFRDSTDLAMTQSGMACGTPLYFSPEQAKGVRKLDIRSDIYSLGITLYHLIDGAPPFTGDSPFVVFQKHVNEPLPPFTKVVPPVPDSVFKLLKKMTAKNPNDRHANSEELLRALESLQKQLFTKKKKRVSAPKRRTLLEKLGFKPAD
ncbi:MAG: protein kinase domain-containing protein [Desulfomonilaceae bacterium]